MTQLIAREHISHFQSNDYQTVLRF